MLYTRPSPHTTHHALYEAITSHHSPCSIPGHHLTPLTMLYARPSSHTTHHALYEAIISHHSQCSIPGHHHTTHHALPGHHRSWCGQIIWSVPAPLFSQSGSAKM
eukprot:1161685-Pelagomonas_calceolata.AAC.26